MFRVRRARRSVSERPTIRTVDGQPTVIVHRSAGHDDEFRLRDLVLISRVRGLELADDRWQLTFRPEGQVIAIGKAGARLTARVQRHRPDLVVQVHYPDDD